MMLMPLVVRPRYLLLKRLRSPWGSALGSGRILLVRNPKWSSFLYEKSTISKKKKCFQLPCAKEHFTGKQKLSTLHRDGNQQIEVRDVRQEQPNCPQLFP